MSRVFDALQEAARLSGSTGVPKEAVWRELGIDSTEGANLKADVAKGTAASALLEGEPASDSLRQQGAMPPAGGQLAPANSFAGSQLEISLDAAAPLLPHTEDPRVVERYRMLRTKLLQEREKRFFRSLVIASPNPQEGKTVTVLNLALCFAALPSFKLLVVDGDMRRGTMGDWLGVDRSTPGLSNLIEGSAQLGDVLLTSNELAISVIPRGNTQISDLHSAQFSTHFQNLVERFDLVLVDSPPINLMPDVQIIAASCDAVLLVARAFSTTRKSLEEAVDKLNSFRIIGTVLNAGMPRRSRKYHGYY